MWNKMPKGNKYIFKGSKDNHSKFFFFWGENKGCIGQQICYNRLLKHFLFSKNHNTDDK